MTIIENFNNKDVLTAQRLNTIVKEINDINKRVENLNEFVIGTNKDNKSSIVIGDNNNLNDQENCILIGTALQAGAKNQAIFGTYNEANSNSLLIIGNGASSSTRNNLVEVTTEGEIKLNGQPLITKAAVEDIQESLNGRDNDLSNTIETNKTNTQNAISMLQRVCGGSKWSEIAAEGKDSLDARITTNAKDLADYKKTVSGQAFPVGGIIATTTNNDTTKAALKKYPISNAEWQCIYKISKYNSITDNGAKTLFKPTPISESNKKNKYICDEGKDEKKNPIYPFKCVGSLLNNVLSIRLDFSLQNNSDVKKFLSEKKGYASITIGTIDFTELGLTSGSVLPNSLLHIPVSGDAPNGMLLASVTQAGEIRLTDVIKTPTKFAPDKKFSLQFSIPIHYKKIADAACDKFFWERTK